MNKHTLTLLEADFIAAMHQKILSSQYDHTLNKQISYLKMSYSKATDDVTIALEPDEINSNRVSLTKASMVAWLIPQIQSLEYKYGKDIDFMEALFDKENNQFDTQIVGEEAEV